MTRSCAKSWCAYGEWGEAHMGSAYDFNLLMYFLALRIGTRCLPVISFWVYPVLYSQRWKSWQLYTCLPSLRPFVSPLSPLCLPYSPFVSSSLSLLLPAAEARDLWKGWKLLPASELAHFDRRCANRISTWRKIIDVWRKRCAMRLAQVLVNGVGSRRGSGQRCFARLIWH